MIRTRFAPSPTGDLHLGGAWTALASWAFARAHAGRTLLRVEDIDTPRVVAGSASRIEEDLAWLGLDWDEGPTTQSERTSLYAAELARLAGAGLTYPCDCSRAEIARVASAPHAGEDVVYPGTCRDKPVDRELRRPPAIRLRVPAGAEITFDDLSKGTVVQRVDLVVADFVLRRGDGVFSYQFVVAVDDAAMRISHVIRGDDLLASTARQLLLMRLLGRREAELPRYAHVPLVVADGGERVAKRVRSSTVRALRERGVDPRAVIAALAHGLCLVPESAPQLLEAREVAARLTEPATWRKHPWTMPDHLSAK